MNIALSNIFLADLPKAIHEACEPIRMKQRNTVILEYSTGSSQNTAKQQPKIVS
jgi:hypothetical protein